MMHSSSRRHILKSATVAAISNVLICPGPALGSPGNGKKIIIIGSGLSGLVSAYELKSAGHQVTVLESQQRPGGRVLTLRDEIDKKIIGDAGAARIRTSHHYTLGYARHFGLSLEPFYNLEGGGYIKFTDSRRKVIDWNKFEKSIKKIHRISLETADNWVKIQGGNDLLPKSFENALLGSIQYGAPVNSIHVQSDQVQVSYIQYGINMSVSGDYLICTVPFSVIDKINFEPGLSTDVQNEIQRLKKYVSASRLFSIYDSEFWLAHKLNGFAVTDNAEIWPTSSGQYNNRGVLQHYSRASHSESITEMTSRGRQEYARDYLEKVIPGGEKNYNSGVSKCWGEDIWAKGGWVNGWAKFEYFARPENRIMFAGEHLSHYPSWMQGALQSGIYAARNIHMAV